MSDVSWTISGITTTDNGTSDLLEYASHNQIKEIVSEIISNTELTVEEIVAEILQ